jgi:Ca2+:H+ antiporter
MMAAMDTAAPEFMRTKSPNLASPPSILKLSSALVLAWAWAVVGAFALRGGAWLAEPLSPVTASVAFVVLFATILMAAFVVVREADHLAHQLGEPYGTLILTLSVVIIEVVLIAAIMLGPGEYPTVGRDAIFSVMMIILNLVAGLCLVFGGARYGEQEYNAQGSATYLSMIALLTGIGLILPNYTAMGGGQFSTVQAVAVSVVIAVLYSAFLTMQTRAYSRLFVQPPAGKLSIPMQAAEDADDEARKPVDTRAAVLHSAVLIFAMVPIVLLAHDLAYLIDYGIAAVKAPVALGGVLIAIIVFTPESMTAIRAALDNEMQRVVNLCLGAFLSTVGLTVPAVLMVGALTGKTVVMGLAPMHVALFGLTVAVHMLTLIGHRTTPIQGMMHLTLFAVYVIVLFFP